MQVPHHNYEVSGNVQTPYRGFAPGPHRGFSSPRPSVFDLQQKIIKSSTTADPLPVLCPWTLLGDFPRPPTFDPLATLSHIQHWYCTSFKESVEHCM